MIPDAPAARNAGWARHGWPGDPIYDTMQYLSCDVATICMGQASSMGAFLLAAGTKGKRYALPHSRIMIHPAPSKMRWTCATDTVLDTGMAPRWQFR